MTEEKRAKRRGWVKNAAIIFLAIMLVLTFASNTIMNRSLPEVSAQYPTSGTITAKVRGSGVVEANQTYEVSISQTRKVQSVPVKVGDTVSEGDTLFVLEDEESAELDQARDTLDQLELDYQKALISATQLDYVQENVNIQRAKDDLDKAIAERDELYVSPEDLNAAQAAVNSVEIEIAVLEGEIAEIQRQMQGLSPNGVDTTSAWNAYQDAITAVTAAETAQAQAETAEKSTRITYQTELASITSGADSLMIANGITEAAAQNANRPLYMEAAAVALDAAIAPADAVYVAAYGKIKAAEKAVSDAKALVTQRKTERDRAYNTYINLANSDTSAQYNSLNTRLTNKQSALTASQNIQKTYQAALTELETNKTSYEAKAQSVISQQRALEDMIQALSEQQRGDSVTSQLESLNFETMRKAINEQRALINELTAESIGAVVKAAQGGVISSLNVTAGNTAPADSVMAVIELTDGGYSLSFAVTNEQSQKVSVGDVAEVITFRWGADITATLASIKNDPSNPGQGKILGFTIKGDVTVGEQLNLSVGQKSANYETIVPNSAVREDSNGSFVLIVESRSSPLSTRYAAVRVDVTVLSKDDTSSAITGALTSWDFVITTSSAPLEPGMLVRLAEG